MGNKLKKFFFDLISFNTPLARVINISFIFIFLFFIPTSDLILYPKISVYSGIIIPYLFNNSCPSEGIFTNCGFYSVGQTRALSSLLHGDVELAQEYNRLVFVLLIVLIIVWIINLLRVYENYKKRGSFF